MATFRWLLALFMLALAALPASAAEPTYPPGSRIGLAPPAGLVPSKTFFGYEDLNNSVAMIQRRRGTGLTACDQAFNIIDVTYQIPHQ